MYPMYRFMDQHPYQRNHGPYNPHYYPHFESNPHHMSIDPSRPSLAYESWPCGGNYGQPFPPQYHSCCIHNNSPNHCAFRPPYPYIPPPPCSNLAYPGMYPAHYVPPPHFTMEQPPYEYDKNMGSDHHCCGCQNHLCNKKGGSNVKIEEQEQDKKNEGHESLVPFGFKNSPFPVVWLPPDYMKNGERMKATESKGNEQEDHSQIQKPYGDFRSLEQPKVWNMWPPYHGNNSESPKPRGGPPSKQCHDDKNNKQFPFPIIWMPYKPEEAGGKTGKETDSGNCVEQESASPSISTRPRLHDANEERIDSRENEANSGSEIRGKGMNKDSVMKTIPVKQVQPNEKVLNEKTEDASKRHDGDAKEKKIIQDSGKKQSSPSKSSKLPPVCLRVDPLPRKKSTNASSRSPSPPGRKGKLVEPSSDSSKPPILSNKENVQLDKSLATGMPEKSITVEPSKSKTKVVEVAQGTSKEEKLKDQCTVFPDLKGQTRGQTGESDTGRAANEPKYRPDRVAAFQSSNEGHQSGEAGEAAARKADAVDDMKKDQRRKLSDDEAATMIQSAYRGFNIRRWEPLNKLKQISKIKGQMEELKNRIQALETSADDGADDKEKTIITEAIMGLLLKLDTVQGLHPTVREYRKSVARDLVSLQEKLDLLNCKKQPAESEQAFTAKSSEDTSRTREDHVSLQGGQEVQTLEQDDDLGNGDEVINFDTKEPCKENKNVEDMMENFSSGSAMKMGHEASELPSKSKENLNDTLLEDNAIVVEKSEEHDKAELSFPNPIPLYEELIENSGAEVRGCGMKKGKGVDELEELPQGALDEEASAQGPTDTRKDKDLQHDNPNIPEGKSSDTEALEHHQIEALGETSIFLGPESMNSSNRQEENSEVLEPDATVHIDIPEKKKEEGKPLKEDAKISDVDCKVDMEKNGKGVEQCGTASDVLSMQSQDDAISMKQSIDTTDAEDSETTEVLQEKMQNELDTGIEILDSGIPIELSAEPQLSTVTNEDVGEYDAPDKQNVREENMFVRDEESPEHNDAMKGQEENMAVQGEESPVHSDVLVSLPDDEGQEHNVEVEQKLLEEHFEMQGAEQVPADNAAPTTEDSVDGNGAMAAPTSEAAATETQILGKELAENHNTYTSTCDAIECSSAEAAHSFSSTPTEAQVMDMKEHKEWKKVDVSPSSPTASQVSFDSDAFPENDRKLIEENEKLREMMEKLLEAGKEQLTTISSLSERVKDLEKRLSRKKKLKLKRNRIPPAGSACMKPSNDPLKDRAVGLAM